MYVVRCNGTNLHRVHPWIHQYENNISAEHQMQCVTFPDTNPTELSLMKTQFTMIAGDFLEVILTDIVYLYISCFKKIN